MECKECNYRCVESETIENYPHLQNSSCKNQSLSKSNKLYSNSNSLNSNQHNSDLLNKCKRRTVSNSSILSSQSSSSIPSPTCLSNPPKPPLIFVLNPYK